MFCFYLFIYFLFISLEALPALCMRICWQLSCITVWLLTAFGDKACMFSARMFSPDFDRESSCRLVTNFAFRSFYRFLATLELTPCWQHTALLGIILTVFPWCFRLSWCSTWVLMSRIPAISCLDCCYYFLVYSVCIYGLTSQHLFFFFFRWVFAGSAWCRALHLNGILGP